jgi:nucleoside-diphosphate-sugar epimerase
MKILVRGGTGFVGRHVVWRSLLSGYDTVFTGRSPEAAALVMEMARRVSPDRLPVFHLEGHALGEPFDVVIDCAGKVDLVGSRADYVAANVDRTSAAWAHARERGAHTFVSVSSASVLFACRDQLGLTDGVPATPPGIHPYADSKALSETMLWARRGQGPAIRIIRPRGVYGPYDSGVLPRILKVARRLGGRFPLPAPGALASMTAASNLAHAVLLAAEAPASVGDGIWNVSDGDDRPLGELIQLAGQAAGQELRPFHLPGSLLRGIGRAGDFICWPLRVEPRVSLYTAELLCRSRTLCIDAIRRDLGYAPLLSVEKAFASLAEFTQHGTLPELSIMRPQGGTR